MIRRKRAFAPLLLLLLNVYGPPEARGALPPAPRSRALAKVVESAPEQAEEAVAGCGCSTVTSISKADVGSFAVAFASLLLRRRKFK